MPGLEAKQDILCAYPISSQYCYAPRVLYYALVAATLLIRKQEWLAVGAAAYVMTYAASAAVHAVILCAIHASSTPMLPDASAELGHGTSNSISARVLDLDMDATLAIVGIGFLMLLPMAVFSSTFRTSKAKPILVAWGLLMLIGAICCLATLYTVDATPNGPFRQYRICDLDEHSIISAPTSTSSLGDDWNSTIRDYFSEQSARKQECFYPWQYSSQILRSRTDISLIKFPVAQPGSKMYWAFKLLSAVVYACVPLYIAGGIILVLHQRFGNQGSKDQSVFQSIKTQLVALVNSPLTFKVALRFVFVSFQAYALVFAPVVMAVFIAFAEYSLSLDPVSESIRHVGQWQPLLSVAFVIIAAIIRKYSKE